MTSSMYPTPSSADRVPLSTAPVEAPSRILAAALGAGALFGFGLAFSTMIRPDVVLGFLRFQDLGLMLVLGGAVLVTFFAYRFLPRFLERPLLGGRFA
ncbi:MAG: hypothetical protein IT354_05565, partial [Gemmatimonadaceae bacterium]|nr:hypothetical protein [Gemmatimonadaceae bacterium]